MSSRQRQRAHRIFRCSGRDTATGIRDQNGSASKFSSANRIVAEHKKPYPVLRNNSRMNVCGSGKVQKKQRKVHGKVQKTEKSSWKSVIFYPLRSVILNKMCVRLLYRSSRKKNQRRGEVPPLCIMQFILQALCPSDNRTDAAPGSRRSALLLRQRSVQRLFIRILIPPYARHPVGLHRAFSLRTKARTGR